MKSKIRKAEGHSWGEMGSFGKASNMLMRQFNYPAEYDNKKDVLRSADSDRLLDWDYAGFRATLKKHLGHGEMSIGELIRATDSAGNYIMSDADVFAFIKEALKTEEQNPGVEWTGYRVTGTVNRSNGYPIFTLSLFANLSGVEVYSGDFAPNVDHQNNMMVINADGSGMMKMTEWSKAFRGKLF